MDCRLVEAILFLSAKGWRAEGLAKLLRKPKREVEGCLEELEERYRKHPTLEVKRVGEEWELTLKQDVAYAVRRYYRKALLSPREVELLAYIAKAKTTLKSKLAKRFGSWVYSAVKELREKGFLQEFKAGRTSMLKVTKKFDEYFKVGQ